MNDQAERIERLEEAVYELTVAVKALAEAMGPHRMVGGYQKAQFIARAVKAAEDQIMRSRRGDE